VGESIQQTEPARISLRAVIARDLFQHGDDLVASQLAQDRRGRIRFGLHRDIIRRDAGQSSGGSEAQARPVSETPASFKNVRREQETMSVGKALYEPGGGTGKSSTFVPTHRSPSSTSMTGIPSRMGYFRPQSGSWQTSQESFSSASIPSLD
jgi:hypothetical protein